MTLPSLQNDVDLDLIDMTLSWLNQQESDSQNHKGKPIVLERREEKREVKIKHFTCDKSDNCDICEFNEEITAKNHAKVKPGVLLIRKQFETEKLNSLS